MAGARTLGGRALGFAEAAVLAMNAGCDLVLLCNQSVGNGKPLDDLLRATGLPAGDFVRNCKQLLDLLRQIEEVAPPEVAPTARAAYHAVNRGVVSYTGVSPVEP